MRIFLPALLGIALAANLTAAITYSGVQNIPIPTNLQGIYLDFTDGDNAATVGRSFTNPGTWDFNLFYGGAGLWNSATFQPVTDTAATNAAVVNLSPDDIVSGSSTFPPLSPGFSGSTGHMGAGAEQWQNGDSGYIGFRVLPAAFTSNAPSGTIYGWMHVTLQDDGITPGMIHSWAWETSGDPITIPEPATAALAACSLAGFVLLRRSRKEQTLRRAPAR